MRYGYGSGQDWLWMLGFMTLMTAVTVVVVVALVRSSRRHRDGASGRAVLDERYARGEITTAEYEERRAALRR